MVDWREVDLERFVRSQGCWMGWAAAFLSVALLTGCTPGTGSRATPEGQDAEIATARRGVEQAIDSAAAAMERADIDRVLRGLAEDFVLRRADGVVRGREAMRPVWEANFEGWIYEDSRTSIERFSASGGIAVASGLMGGLLRPKGRPSAAPPDSFALPYLAEWHRLGDGRWVLRDLAVIYPAGK